MTEQANEKWVILEAMGHRVAAGRYFIENGLHRVDIPDVSPDAEPGSFIRSEWYGNAAIFCITPVTEDAARLMAGRCTIPEAIPWDVRQTLTKMVAAGETREALPAKVDPVEQAIDDGFIPDICSLVDEDDLIAVGGEEDEEAWITFDDDLPETEL